ncbi:MAG: hypothetical protein DME31_08995 [Verrucomicrobia bacterium]|nr:MAG: hypothetical protein DME31_08995 [Verrucomicrobiota bacterium]
MSSHDEKSRKAKTRKERRHSMAQQIHTYTELRQRIHDDLRLQHPDWVQPNGESPICDSYEARLMELIDALTGMNVERLRESPML